MKQIALFITLASNLILCSPAEARRCPHGQILLLHKQQCMDRAAFRNVIHHRATRVELLPKDDPLMHNHGLTYVHVIEAVDPCGAWHPASQGWPGSWIEAKGLRPRPLIGMTGWWLLQ
jgi:hypothetical protein